MKSLILLAALVVTPLQQAAPAEPVPPAQNQLSPIQVPGYFTTRRYLFPRILGPRMLYHPPRTLYPQQMVIYR